MEHRAVREQGAALRQLRGVELPRRHMVPVASGDVRRKRLVIARLARSAMAFI